MRGRSLAEVATGAVILIIAGLFLTYAVVHSGRGLAGGEGMVLHASFDRIDGLNNGADVRIAGVKVGAVTADVISVSSLSSITGNMGLLTAGKIQSPDGKFVIDLDSKFISITV